MIKIYDPSDNSVPAQPDPAQAAHLRSFLTPRRLARFEEVLSHRTNFLTVVLEDLYDPHNSSAVIRSCDIHGVQNLHVVENRHTFDSRRGVTMGADKWIDICRYNTPEVNNTEVCFERLRKAGYEIRAASPHENSGLLPDVKIQRPMAIVFGSEKDGLSDYAMENVDGFIKIPMFGFSESLNISVSAATCLYDLTSKLRAGGQDPGLSPADRRRIEFQWLTSSVTAWREILERFQTENDTTSVI